MGKADRKARRSKAYHSKRWRRMRQVTFTQSESDQLRFEVLYKSFIMCLDESDKGYAVTRTSNKIYDKLEEISEVETQEVRGTTRPVWLIERQKEPMRRLKPEVESVVLSLEDTEAEVVKRRLCNGIWTGKEGRAFQALHEELEK